MKKENILLSVIIPVYNGEKYIIECVNSVLKQTYKNLDVILVDDGSTDNSAEICKKIEKQDNRVRMIRIRNSGPYQARNVGAKVSKGDILTFVDADDTLDLNTYESLIDIYEEYNPDMIVFNYEYNNEITPPNYYTEGLYLEKDICSKIIPGMMYDYSLGCRKIEPSVINKIMKKELYLKVTKSIKSRISLGDDALITYPALCDAKRLYITNKVYYHYRKNMDSCTHTYPVERILEVQNFQKEINRLFENRGMKEIMEFQVECYVRSFVSMMVKNWYGIERSSIMYCFPYEKIDKGANLAIYGAGEVGKSYVNAVIKSQYVRIVIWADKNHDEIKSYNGYKISAPEDLLIKRYDKVLIANYRKEIAMKIKNDLLTMGVEGEKIIWEQPKMIG